MAISILFENDSFLVIDKPAGLVSTPAETTLGIPTLADILENEYGIALDRGGLVHRLDKDTSGLILAAKNQVVFENLQSQFKDRGVRKEYLALVHGETPKEGHIEGSIARNPGDREKFIVMDQGREAETDYILEKTFLMSGEKMKEIFDGFSKIQMRRLINYGTFSLLRCHPLTGRTHQIRVHLKSIAHPIVSDIKYSGRKTSRLDKRWCPRQFLHAAKLEFNDPINGKRLSFESPLPTDLKEVLGLLDDR